MSESIEIFLVQHVHTLEDEEEDVKIIGIYSTQDTARKAVERLRLQPGFRESPDDFSVDRYILNMDHWTEGFVTVVQATQAEVSGERP
jgi:hypothetical protein